MNRGMRGWLLVTLVIASCAMTAIAGRQAPATAGARRDLPEARAVIDKFIVAMGGRAAIARYTSRHAAGRFDVPAQGMAGDLETFAARPDKLLVRITLAGLGQIATGFDGRVAWATNPMTGPMVFEGRQRDQLRTEADFDSMLHEGSQYRSIQTMERTEFEGRPCYKLKLVRTTGEEDLEFYDTTTALQVASIVSRETMMGPVTATTLFSDYKDFGGLRFPSRTVQRMLGIEQVLTVTSVEYDTVDPGVFALPPAIRAMVK